MKVSIITTTYNSSATLDSTIKSVLSQSYADIEYLIIDGGSVDGTLSIIKSYSSHNIKVISEPDSGIYDAMNKGIGLATGAIIGFLNSDDFYIGNNVISKVVSHFKQNQVDAVYGDLLYVNYENTNKIVRRWRSGRYEKKKFLFGWMPPHPAFFVKKAVFEQYGLFNLAFKTSADYELMLRFLYKHSISAVHLSEYLVKMRMGGLSNSSFRHRLFANREDLMAWKVNSLKPYFFTTILKPLRKLSQYLL